MHHNITKWNFLEWPIKKKKKKYEINRNECTMNKSKKPIEPWKKSEQNE